MPNNWKTYKLSEVGEIIGGGTPSTTKQEYYNGNISWITPRDLSNHNSMFISKGERSITELGLKNSSAKLMPKGSVLLTSRAPIGYLAISENEVCTNQGFKSIAVNDKIADNKFIYYLLKTNIDLLLQNATGSTFQEVSGNIIKNLEFKFPPLQEQQSIASILSAIDDKIENNLAINKTLEEMAMALYKHWFVDFGPFKDGEFVESELGLIPKGWEVKRLVDFVNLTMGQSPKSEFYNSNNEGLPFHQGVTNYGERFPEDKTYSSEGNRFAEEGDILFSVRAPVGRLNIAKNKIILGRGLSSMTLKNHDNNGFLFYSLKNFFTEDDKIGDGTVYGSVNKTELENLKFIVPYKEVLDDFNDFVKDIDSKYLNNYKENQTLTQLRDTLLPKLISGEVRLKEFR
ncbi:MAG: restriction endonuclease subunit S [Flavobacteriaceae bacterium]|nr:MAG: restriction endonuclease subunit S [Flavobacteriaceae bacterium]